MKAGDRYGTPRRRTLGAALAAFLLAGAAPAPPPPALHLTLHPVTQGGRVARVEVRMALQDPHLAANEALLRMPTRIVGIPTSAYQGGEIDARDRNGPLALTAQDEPPRPEGIYRRYLTGRATEGDVVIRYAAKPREVGPSTNNGPLFDMRREGAGFEGAGISFLAVPPREAPYRVTLDWDFAGMPAGSRGAWSLGEGRVERVATAQQLAFSYYAGGPFHRFPANGKFGIFWLTEPPFPIATLADRISRLYAAMSGFFDDRDSTYRVFLRQDPYRGVGGTALPGSFMVGYYAPAHPSVDEIQQLLAHEMVHNWPALQGEHGDTAWYSEGTAEYYSLIFAYRAGLLDRPRLLREVNERANSYYTHPFRGLSNKEAAQRFWSDPFAQQVPYGRGFLYLARTDAAIRGASNGRRSLDDVVRELRRRQRTGQPYGIAQWLELVEAEIGRERADRDYRDMVAGKTVEPGSAFGPCFRGVKEERPVFDLGFARRSLADEAVVRDLKPDSNAARAGLREGDAILSYSELKPLIAKANAQMVLKVRREGAERTISYVPRGAPVATWVFADEPSVPAQRCRF